MGYKKSVGMKWMLGKLAPVKRKNKCEIYTTSGRFKNGGGPPDVLTTPPPPPTTPSHEFHVHKIVVQGKRGRGFKHLICWPPSPSPFPLPPSSGNTCMLMLFWTACLTCKFHMWHEKCGEIWTLISASPLSAVRSITILNWKITKEHARNSKSQAVRLAVRLQHWREPAIVRMGYASKKLGQYCIAVRSYRDIARNLSRSLTRPLGLTWKLGLHLLRLSVEQHLWKNCI